MEGKIDSQGRLSEAVTIKSEDGRFGVTVDIGTKAVDKDGDALERLTLDRPKSIPEPPEGKENIAIADFGPDGATFDTPVTITLGYDPETLPDEISPQELVIAYYDEENEQWIDLADITVDTLKHTVSGSVNHFTLFAIQVLLTAIPPEEETGRPGGESATPEEEAGTSPVRQVFDLPALYHRFQDIIGQEVWVLGYYGEPGFSHSGAAFLVQEFDLLLSAKAMPSDSFARLNGNIPGSEASGAALLIHGIVRDYAQVYPDVYQPEPVPLLTVYDYKILEVTAPGGELIDALAWSPYQDTGHRFEAELVSFLGGIAFPIPIARDRDNTSEAGWSQASDCDRVLIISGGLDDSQNHSMYADNVKAIYEKMAGFGFSNDQIDVVYYTGNAGDIQVGGRNIVDAAATKENIRAIIERYLREMNPSCSLEIFITDHGTGYDGSNWNGTRMATSGSSENGPSSTTYPESRFTLNGVDWLWEGAEFTDSSGRSWAYEKHRFTGEVRLFLREGTSWVYKGNDADGDGSFEEHELGTDINGDGDNTDNYGFTVSSIEAMATHSSGEWDDDRDGNTDLKFNWVGGKLVAQRFINGAWQTIGEDTNGDDKLDAADGGIDWNGDGNKNGQVGFHEGINLLGRNVLWDDEFADMLRPLAERGIHINCIMQQCFSGGFIDNLTGIVEWIGTFADETTSHWAHVVDGKHVAVDLHHFLRNITSLDPLSWGSHWTAAVAENQRVLDNSYPGATAAQKAKWVNHSQTGGTPAVETGTTYKRHDDGMYSISLRLPTDRADSIYDFEIILGLQSDRWQVSLTEGLGFPEGLPEGLDTELVPGGVRVFSTQPLGPTPLHIRMRAPEGTEISRIELTDENHRKVGYATPSTEDIPETNPMDVGLSVTVEDENNPDTCESQGVLTIKGTAKDATGSCTIAMAEIYIDGELANRTRFSKDSADPRTVAIADWTETYTRRVSPGRHVVRLVVTNWYGQKTVREEEITCCEGYDRVNAVSDTTPVQMSVTPSILMEGYAPDCTATFSVTWRAMAPGQQVTLKAAWLKINGAVVATSVPPPGTPLPTNDYRFGLPSFNDPSTPRPVPTADDTAYSLGGFYSCAVQPNSTVTVEIIALGSDCKYYAQAWERPIPGCPDAPVVFIPCFGADTLVLMADGSAKKISDMEIGNVVKTWDSDTGKVITGCVTSVNSGKADHYYLVNGELKVTPPHPFLTIDRGWVPIEELQPGDRIVGINGNTVIATIERVEESQEIYNIGLAETGTFFVSTEGINYYLVKER
ncbi:Hint domain-containing protein [Chloroflexota bacterium]